MVEWLWDRAGEFVGIVSYARIFIFYSGFSIFTASIVHRLNIKLPLQKSMPCPMRLSILRHFLWLRTSVLVRENLWVYVGFKCVLYSQSHFLVKARIKLGGGGEEFEFFNLCTGEEGRHEQFVRSKWVPSLYDKWCRTVGRFPRGDVYDGYFNREVVALDEWGDRRIVF